MNNQLNNQQMFLDNEKLIYFTMKKYFPHIYYNSTYREDYYQIGAIGLLKAVRDYDSSLGTFSTYAVSKIWGEIKRDIRDSRNHIHYNRNIIDMANKLIRTYNEINIEDDMEMWIYNQVKRLDIDYADKLAVINYILNPISLETTLNEDENLTFGDIIPDLNDISNDIDYNAYINNISQKLSVKENNVFHKFINGDTQQNIATSLNLTQSQVSRIEYKIKTIAVRELLKSGYQSLLNNILNDNCSYSFKRVMNAVCQKDKNDLRMETENMEKIYSKKSCQKLILKCVMKLILKNKSNEISTIKELIKKLLIHNGYDNESIMKHLNNMNNSQIKSCIDLARKTIDKYNYNYEYEILINELDFNVSGIVKKERLYELKANKADKLENKKSNNLIDDILQILDIFKQNNLLIRF